VRIRQVLVLAATAVLAGPLTVGAETFRLSAADGTIHYTNAPTDPRYQRSGMTPPPAAAAAGPNVPVALTSAVAPSYSLHIRDAAARYGVSERLVSAVIRVESGFNAKAVSRKGARGLMQLMPATASMLGVRDSFDPLENIDGGVRHLRGLIDRFSNNVPLALAAYNAGEQAVTQHRGIPPYPETQDYVARILRIIGDNDAPIATAPAPQSTYRVVTDDGTTIYTNIPPRGRR
jgi:hypothetical protein